MNIHPVMFLLLVCIAGPVGLFALIFALYILLFVFCWLMTLLHIGEVQYPYAYKTLYWDDLEQEWVGPVMGGVWLGGRLLADCRPETDNESGVYCCKNYWFWQLHLWRMFGGKIHMVEMSNPTIEHKYGYRANGARLVE